MGEKKTAGYPPVTVKGGQIADNKFKDGNKVWLVTSLIERSKELPVFEVPLAGLFSGSGVFDPITSAYCLAKHMKRVQETNLDYPVIMDEEGFIMDGWHRVAKALLEGRKTIKAVRFETTPAPDYTEDE